jgi:hypothetical protein
VTEVLCDSFLNKHFTKTVKTTASVMLVLLMLVRFVNVKKFHIVSYDFAYFHQPRNMSFLVSSVVKLCEII